MSSRPSFPETFLDDLAADNGPAEYDSADDDRDPHDLSLSPQHAVRTSVVDNMLLSLDQFSELNATAYDPTDDPDPYSLYSRWNDTYGHSRGHTFSSSLSSDVDGHASPHGRYSEQTVRGRRSNSSSNFPSVTRDRVSARGMVNDSQRASNRGDQSSYSRQTRSGRAHSQSSDSSVDLKQLLTETRISQSRHNRRSASFDYGSRPTKADALRTKRPSQDQDLQYHDIDAAPTPTVPGGPRKELDQGFSYNKTPALSRKNSGKSSKSAHNKKGRADTIGTATIRRHPDNNFDYFRDVMEDVPPMPGYSQPTAPSPTIPRHKSLYFTPIENSPPPSQPSQMSPPPAPAPAPAQPKERPGFFRRVFGSSKSSTPAQTQRDAPRVRDNENQAYAKAQNSVTDKQKSASPSNKLSRENAHVVTKKPSSFFRRRKKSTTDHTPPPPLVLGHSNMQFSDAPKGENPRMEVLRNGEGPEPSPVSSLRNVMKPYLADTHSGPRGNSRHDSDVDDDNHSIEIPLRNPARPGSSQVTGRGSQRTDRDYTPAQSSTRATNSRSTADTRPSKHSRSGSFLADSSDNEGPSDAKSGGKLRRPVTSASVPNQPPERLFEHNKSTFRDSITPNSMLQASTVPSSSHATSPSVAKGELNDSSTPGLSSSGNRDSLQPSSAHGAATSPHQTTWIDHTSSTEQLDEPSKPHLPIDGTTHSPIESVSTASHYQTAANTPIIPVEDGGAGWGTLQVQPQAESNPLSDIEEDQPRDSHKGAAQDEPTAAWLGAPDRAEARKAYMEQFDWSDMNILAALRGLCSKLVLKGETQQVDRILDALSARWCECNPNHGFKATGMISLLYFSCAKLTWLHRCRPYNMLLASAIEYGSPSCGD